LGRIKTITIPRIGRKVIKESIGKPLIYSTYF